MRYTNRWALPEVMFYQVEDHGFSGHGDRPLYAYGKPDEMDSRGLPKTGELFVSLDRALIAWVGEKYTGPRGAGGTGVGTAANWFARMIGMDTLVAVDYSGGQKLLTTVLAETAKHDGPIYVRARAVADGLEAAGVTLATFNGSPPQ
jgi:hypothetical protein